MIARLLDRLKCRVFGHTHGKLTGYTKNPDGKTITRSFMCRRCPATWHRKVKAS